MQCKVVPSQWPSCKCIAQFPLFLSWQRICEIIVRDLASCEVLFMDTAFLLC